MQNKQRRNRLDAKVKTAVAKCYKVIEDLKPKNTPTKEIESVVMGIFDIKRTQVKKIMKVEEDGLKFEDAKVGHRPKSEHFKNDILKNELAQRIYQYHKECAHFTLNDLLHYSQEELEYKGSRTTLYLVLKSMGYRYKKVDGRKILIESKFLLSRKIAFLKNYLQYKNERATFVFLDETWIYRNGSNVRMWVKENDRRGNPSKVMNEGKRFTVLHAGSENGFLEGCSLLLDSKFEHRDYHKNMNGELFKNWVEFQLMPAIKEQLNGKVVVVMDNASYHSVLIEKPPSSSSSKHQMQEWLQKHQVNFDDYFTKKQLWALIKPLLANKINRKYVVDEMLFGEGIEVLRLPPYHCQYNPIEMVWGFCKNYYNKHIRSRPSSRDKVKNVWLEALSKYTSEMWNNSIGHCERLIENDWKKYMGEFSVCNIPPIIISLAESDSESDSNYKFDDRTEDDDNYSELQSDFGEHSPEHYVERNKEECMNLRVTVDNESKMDVDDNSMEVDDEKIMFDGVTDDDESCDEEIVIVMEDEYE